MGKVRAAYERHTATRMRATPRARARVAPPRARRRPRAVPPLAAASPGAPAGGAAGGRPPRPPGGGARGAGPPSAGAAAAARRATRRVALTTTAIALAVCGDARDARARPLAVVEARDAVARDGGRFTFEIELPRGYHFTEGANSRYETTAAASGTRGALEGDGGAKRTVVVRAAEGVNEARVDCVVYFCRTDDVCLMQRVRFEVPVATGGASETTAEYVVAAEANDAAVPSFD